MKPLGDDEAGPKTVLAGKVLLVDGDAEQRQQIGGALAAAGLLAATAQNGFEAIELASRQQPDVVVLDLALPDMSGFQLVRWLKTYLPGARVVVHTAWDERRYQREALRAGADRFLVKPAVGGSLLAAVAELVP